MLDNEYSPKEIWENLSPRKKILAGVAATAIAINGMHELPSIIEERSEAAKQHELAVKYGPTEPRGVHYAINPDNPPFIEDGARLRSDAQVEPRSGDPADPSNLYFELPYAAIPITPLEGVYYTGDSVAASANAWVQIPLEYLKSEPYIWDQIPEDVRAEMEKDADGWIAVSQQKVSMHDDSLIRGNSSLEYTD